MEKSLQPLAIRPDFEHDPAGARLERFLRAESAHAHARARRNFLAHVAAVVGIPAWLVAAGIGSPSARNVELLLLPAVSVGFLASVAAEWWWRRRLDAAERALDAEPGTHRGPQA